MCRQCAAENLDVIPSKANFGALGPVPAKRQPRARAGPCGYQKTKFQPSEGIVKQFWRISTDKFCTAWSRPRAGWTKLLLASCALTRRAMRLSWARAAAILGVVTDILLLRGVPPGLGRGVANSDWPRVWEMTLLPLSQIAARFVPTAFGKALPVCNPKSR